jgi:hypothetical protein
MIENRTQQQQQPLHIDSDFKLDRLILHRKPSSSISSSSAFNENPGMKRKQHALPNYCSCSCSTSGYSSQSISELDYQIQARPKPLDANGGSDKLGQLSTRSIDSFYPPTSTSSSSSSTSTSTNPGISQHRPRYQLQQQHLNPRALYLNSNNSTSLQNHRTFHLRTSTPTLAAAGVSSSKNIAHTRNQKFMSSISTIASSSSASASDFSLEQVTQKRPSHDQSASAVHTRRARSNSSKLGLETQFNHHQHQQQQHRLPFYHCNESLKTSKPVRTEMKKATSTTTKTLSSAGNLVLSIVKLIIYVFSCFTLFGRRKKRATTSAAPAPTHSNLSADAKPTINSCHKINKSNFISTNPASQAMPNQPFR